MRRIQTETRFHRSDQTIAYSGERESGEDAINRKVTSFANRVVRLSADDTTVTEPQGRIYEDQLHSMQSIIDRYERPRAVNAAEPQSRTTPKNWALHRSFARISDPSRLVAEYESAFQEALKKPRIKLNGLNSSEIAQVLGDEIGRTMLENIVNTFKLDTASVKSTCINAMTRSAAKRISKLNKIAPDQSNMSAERNRASQSVILHEIETVEIQGLSRALEDSSRDGEAELRKLEPKLAAKMKRLIKKAIDVPYQGTELPFNLASQLEPLTEPPAVPKIGYGANGRARNKKTKEAIENALARAGRCAVYEGILTNADVIKVGTTAAVTTGLAKAYRDSGAIDMTKINSVYTGAISGLAGAAIVIFKDSKAGRLLLSNQLNGVNLDRDLRDPSSPFYNARKNLSNTLGTRWMSDFEKFARDPDSLGLEPSSQIAKDFKAQLGHVPALNAESQFYYSESKLKPSRLDNERIRRGINGAERFVDEEKLLQIIITDRENTLHPTSINREEAGNSTLQDIDSTGIRCLARLEDGKPTDDVKKLYELCRRELDLKSEKVVQLIANAWIRTQYPRATAPLLRTSQFLPWG